MNTILLQKILDILTEGLAHVGDFFKDLFVSDPQDGQVIGYDAEAGKWKNMYVDDISLEVTKVTDTADIVTFSDAGADLPLKSLKANINVESGTDEVIVTQTGVNIWDEETELGSIDSSGNLIPGSTTIRSKNAIKVKPNTTYYFLSAGSNGYIYGYDADGNFSGWGSGQINNNTFTTDANTHFIRFRMASGYGTTYLNNMGIMSDVSQTDYVAYTGETYTVSLPASVTSGYVDVITGAGMSGDTPFTVTPVIIKSTSGINNIYASSGTVRAVYYTATAGDIKSLVCITEDITSEITANTTDWSDLQYKVVKNNNVVTIYLYSATTTEHGSTELFSGLPRAAYNGPVLLFDTDNNAVVNAKVDTSGYLDVTLAAGGTVKGTITYVAK